MKDIDELGVQAFRDHPSAAFFYVPVYASKTLRRYGRFVLPNCGQVAGAQESKIHAQADAVGSRAGRLPVNACHIRAVWAADRGRF